MQSASDYLQRTDTAVRKLLEGIESYTALLRPAPIFVGSFSSQAAYEQALDIWRAANEAAIAKSLESQREFLGETIALGALCGSLLQIAAMGLQLFGHNREVPDDWMNVIKPGTKPVIFCVGRRVRDVPLGLIIYAGRNQYAHLDEPELREPNTSVFARLASNHDYKFDVVFLDPAFDLANPALINYAANITSLIGWRSYEDYRRDMSEMLAA
jgi:hypothetical protein